MSVVIDASSFEFPRILEYKDKSLCDCGSVTRLSYTDKANNARQDIAVQMKSVCLTEDSSDAAVDGRPMLCGGTGVTAQQPACSTLLALGGNSPGCKIQGSCCCHLF
jgi:hypothetical protein